MKSLSELYSTHHGKVSDKWGIYLPTYDRIFLPYRAQPVRLLEVGVQNGGSLEIWSKYFTQAQKLIGCDINPACSALQYEDPRVAIVVGDANTDAAEHQITSHAQQFDIVIDDGSHRSSDIIKAFARYFPRVVDGGVFVVEDLHCSYWQEFEGGLHDPYSSMSFFKLLADVVNHEHWGTSQQSSDLTQGIAQRYAVTLDDALLSSIHSVEFINSICVIHKSPAVQNQLGRRVVAGQLALVSGDAQKVANHLSTAIDQSTNHWATLRRPPGELVQGYERSLAERDERIASLNQSVNARDERIASLNQSINSICNSTSWRITAPMRLVAHQLMRAQRLAQLARVYMNHRGGLISGGVKMFVRSLEILRYSGFRGLMQRLREYSVVSSQRTYFKPARTTFFQKVIDLNRSKRSSTPSRQVSLNFDRECFGPGYRFWKHYELPMTVDVIVCVHNALDDVRNCLSSLVRYSVPQCSIIVVDDGSRDDTRDYLREFCAEQGATLLRNEMAKGYTFAANQGMRASSAGCVILLNSDTIVTPGWLEKMVACAESDPKIGLVGPLSNTASWQSIPKIEEDGDWATNPLPEGISIAEMGGLVAKYSGQIYPRMSFLNGFCLLIRRDVIDDIGYFDEETFGRGYGEENDYCLRARKAGWMLALADDAYVYHAQSKSYSHEKRKLLADHAGMQLAAKHGREIIIEGVEQCRWDRELVSVRARAVANFSRERVISSTRTRWEGKRVLFVLPIIHAGGGGNVVITEARAMMRMGVGATLLNLAVHKQAFEQSYPNLDVPVLYADSSAEIPALAVAYDAVIATANHSVEWIAPLQSVDGRPVLGYYIQDFEPYFFAEGSPGHEKAMASYNLVPTMRLFTKTKWNRDEVCAKTGQSPVIVGPSVDVDLFFPRWREQRGKGNVMHIVAMVRPSSPRRNPEGTIAVLSKLKGAFGHRIEVSIFGAEKDGPPIPSGACVAKFTNYGQLTPKKTAKLLSSADVFIDMSHFQAMGLTAMEAMACGAIPVVPRAGGAASFAQHGVNALVVDTHSVDEVFAAVSALLDDGEKRRAMQGAALASVAHFFPELPARAILETLFQSKGSA